MFQSARFKLTSWYLLIIMIVSVLFSVALYFLLSSEITDNYNRMLQRYEQRRHLFPGIEFPAFLDPKELDSSRDRVKLELVYINLIILGFSATAGYFLSGKTLTPIKEMVDDQKRFVSDASHELRTPITALKTSTEVNLRDKNLTLSGAKEILKSQLNAINDLEMLSDKLILMTRVKSTTPNNYSEIYLKKIATQAVEMVSPLAKSKKIKINIEIGNEKIFGDDQELTRLIVIFLDNSIKYSPERSLIEITGKKSRNEVRLEIHDQGRGIERRDLPHIFERFYRADKSRSLSNGHGLGLSIAKQIVDKYGGYIKVKSEVGKGTTFMISIPRRKT